jgi:hypothetical protein
MGWPSSGESGRIPAKVTEFRPKLPESGIEWPDSGQLAGILPEPRESDRFGQIPAIWQGFGRSGHIPAKWPKYDQNSRWNLS